MGADAAQAGLSLRDFGSAFALGKELIVDELVGFLHMELNWSEFLVSLAALMCLRNDYDPEFLADMLTDFAEDNLRELYDKEVTKTSADSAAAAFGTQDKSMAPL